MVKSLNHTIRVTHSHDFLGGDIQVKRYALDRDFLAPIHPLPNFTATTSCHDTLGILDFVLDQKICG